MINQTWYDETTNFSTKDFQKLYEKIQSRSKHIVLSISLNKKNFDELKENLPPSKYDGLFGLNQILGIKLIQSPILQDNQFMYETSDEMILHTIGEGELRIPKDILKIHPTQFEMGRAL